MFYRNSFLVLYFLLNVLSFQACSVRSKEAYQSPKGYDLKNPEILYLNDALFEISGICFYPKDSSVFAITDENGYLYKIHLTKNFLTQRWYFDKNLDYEDLFYKDKIFYVLASSGDIHALKFSDKGDTITTQTTVFDPPGKKKHEFESLYYDPQKEAFILLCKKCENDNKNEVSAWAYRPADAGFTPSAFTINTDVIAKKAGLKKLKFEPSAATINPLTGDLWILSSVNGLLVVSDRNGNCKEAYSLDPAIFTQPEGITFSPGGDLIISNEAGNKYSTASLLIFKRKKIS
jgi:uncharacterized protein YjiK